MTVSLPSSGLLEGGTTNDVIVLAKHFGSMTKTYKQKNWQDDLFKIRIEWMEWLNGLETKGLRAIALSYYLHAVNSRW